MKRALGYSFVFILALTAYAFKPDVPATAEVETLSLAQLQSKVIKPGDSTLYVVNFWATWCLPCIKELPYFEDVTKTYGGKKVKVVLVSLDFLSDKARVAKFVETKKLQSDVYMLDAGNPNVWLDAFDKSWDGAIPATVMYKGGKKVYFRQGDFEKAELDSLIKTKINI